MKKWLGLYYGHWVVFSSFAIHFAALGICYSAGLYVVPLQKTFNVGRGVVSFLPTLYFGPLDMLAFPFGFLIDEVQRRNWNVTILYATGGCIAGVGLICGSVSPHFTGVISFALVTGIGLCVVSTAAATCALPWYNRRRGTATGIAFCGSGIGNFVYAIVLQRIMSGHPTDNEGWRVAMRYEGICSLVILIFAASIIRMPKTGEIMHYPYDEIDEVVISDQDETTTISKLTLFQILSTKAYVMILLHTFFASFGYLPFFTHISAFAVDSGLSSETASVALSVVGVGLVLGRLVLGYLGDLYGRIRTLILSMLCLMVTVLIWPFCGGNAPAILILSVTYGFQAGCFITLATPIITDYYGNISSHKLFSLIGLMLTVISPGEYAGPPIVGFLFDRYGSYFPGAFFAAIMILIGNLFLCMIPTLSDHRKSLVNRFGSN